MCKCFRYCMFPILMPTNFPTNTHTQQHGNKNNNNEKRTCFAGRLPFLPAEIARPTDKINYSRHELDAILSTDIKLLKRKKETNLSPSVIASICMLLLFTAGMYWKKKMRTASSLERYYNHTIRYSWYSDMPPTERAQGMCIWFHII